MAKATSKCTLRGFCCYFPNSTFSLTKKSVQSLILLIIFAIKSHLQFPKLFQL